MLPSRLTVAALLLVLAVPATAAATPKPQVVSPTHAVTAAPGTAVSVRATVRTRRAVALRIVLRSLGASPRRIPVAQRRFARPSGHARTRSLAASAGIPAGRWQVLACARSADGPGAERCVPGAATLTATVTRTPAPALPAPLPPAPSPAPLPAPERADVPAAPIAPVAASATDPTPSPAPAQQPAAVRECGLPTAGADAAPEAFDAMWASSTLGWTGGDGTFSVALGDGRELWLFGDSFVGGLLGDGGRDPATPLPRNTLVVQDGDCLTTLFRGSAGDATAYFPAPAGPVEQWYWPNQAVVRGDAVEVLLTRMARTGPGPWDLAVAGSALATIDLATLDLLSIDPVATPPGVYAGAAVADDGDWTYVFGVRDGGATKDLLVARRPAGASRPQEDSQWWDGTGWASDPQASRPVLTGVGNQLSVLRPAPGGGWLLLTQPAIDGRLVAFAADAPTGPWTGPDDVAALPAVQGGMTYNALAHPELSSPDGLLVSVNVNAADPGDLRGRPELYRPRFTRVPLLGSDSP